jgi:hypothetical protein
MFEAKWEKRKMNFERHTRFIWHSFILEIDDNFPAYRLFNLDPSCINVCYTVLSLTSSRFRLIV